MQVFCSVQNSKHRVTWKSARQMSAVAVISNTSVLFFVSLNSNLNEKTRSKNNIRYQRTMSRSVTCTFVFVYLASLAIILYFEDVETKEIIVKQLKVIPLK